MLLKKVMNKRLLLKNKNMKYVLPNIKRVVVVLVVHQPKQVKLLLNHHQAKDHQRKVVQQKKLHRKQNHPTKIMKTMMMMKTKNKSITNKKKNL